MKRHADGTCSVNTSTICKARGYRKGTPVEVYFKNGKVLKVVALKNEETVPYFARIKKFLLPLYNNLKVSKAKKLTERTDIDGCTGATFSTKAVQKNIQTALDITRRTSKTKLHFKIAVEKVKLYRIFMCLPFV